MKKLTIGLVLAGLFSVGAMVGLNSTSAQAGPCFYRCICSVPHKCCTSASGTTCKPAPNGPIQCPQVSDC